MKIYFTFFLSLVALSILCQRSGQMDPIFSQGTAYRNTGWFLAPGITYMLPDYHLRGVTDYVPGGDANDTLYSGTHSRTGKIGFYLEGGRHHFRSEAYVIHHIDYGVHFKMLRGTEKFVGTSNMANLMVPVESSARFSESFVGAFFNASNIIQIKQKLWLQNSLGANADLRIISRRNSTNSTYGAPMNFPNLFLAQVHYKLGFGWKPEPGIYIIPSIETPILTAFPWDNGKSSLQYFAGRYRPFIFTLIIQWLSMARDRKCEGQPGKSGPSDIDKEKPGKHKHNGLWGPETKKMKRAKKKG